MKARGITPEELSKMSGCNVGNIRRIMKLDSLDFVYKSTTEKLSKALGVTPRELVKGGKSMKKKILQTEVTRAAETLCNALRAYTDEPLYLRIAVFSRDKSVICDGIKGVQKVDVQLVLYLVNYDDILGLHCRTCSEGCSIRQ